MRLLIFILIVFNINGYSQNSLDYISKTTILSNLNSEDYTEIKENTSISITPSKSQIVFIKLKDGIVMKFEYYRATNANSRTTYNMLDNKWSVTDMIISEVNGELFITWVYAKPNNTMIVYGPLQKQ